ncbi:MAG: PD-(D/E)XK nuclease family protein [Lachnospiraceae bacterium]|nr:PD-(D/E)XK nuclease family protein [Lachnospiraceae bacterium]
MGDTNDTKITKSIIDDDKFYKQYLDMRNSEAYQNLQKFYHRKTIFDITGIARQENPHSSFIAWLLNPNESHGMNEYPMKCFLETICFAYIKYGQKYLNEDNLINYNLKKDNKNNLYVQRYSEDEINTIHQKLLFFDDEKIDDKKKLFMKKIMQGDYHITSCEIVREMPLPKKRRADIYIKLSVKFHSKETETKLLIFIENKINSTENSEQTEAYMDYMLNNKNPEDDYRFFIPVYLYPASNSDLRNVVDNIGKKKNIFPCKNHLFLLLNYQYLLDGVFSPCRTAYSDNPVSDILSDYIVCLGKSIEDKMANKANEKKFPIMAVSREEKDWSIELWKQHREVLKLACDEFSSSADERFLMRNDSDEQFYRTVLSSVQSYLEDQETQDEEIITLIRNALKDGRATYYVKMEKSGGDVLWEFTSGKRGMHTLGALGYVIIKQYVENYMEQNPNKPDDLKADLREKVSKIKHSWLSGIIADKEQVVDTLKRALETKKEEICTCYYKDNLIDGEWMGCPLSSSKNNPINKKDTSQKEKEDFLQKTDCNYSDLTNGELRDKFSERNEYWCLHDFLHCFFVKDWINDFQEWGKGIDGIKEKLEQIHNNEQTGRNEIFGKIQIGNSDDCIYVARYWGTATIEELLTALEMKEYVKSTLSEDIKTLSFILEDEDITKDNK